MQLSEIQSSLPAGFHAENRRGFLAVFYPGGVSPLEALKAMRTAGATGYNESCGGPAMAFPMHRLDVPAAQQFPPFSGTRGFYREGGDYQATGSAMGRGENKAREVSREGRVKLRARRVRLNSGGYDDGGSYWGTGAPLYEIRGEDEHEQLSFFRRGSKPAVIEKLRAEIGRYRALSGVSIY